MWSFCGEIVLNCVCACVRVIFQSLSKFLNYGQTYFDLDYSGECNEGYLRFFTANNCDWPPVCVGLRGRLTVVFFFVF